MKTLKLIAVGIILFASSSTHAQISVSLNIGSRPSYAPAPVYAEAEYYYLPDVEAYYDIRATEYIYFGGGRWIRSRYLPGEYRNYNFNSGYKVVLNNYHGSSPYCNFDNDRVKYYRGYRGHGQRTVVCNDNRRGYDNRREYDYRRYDNRDYDNRRDYYRGNNRHGNKHDRD